MLQSIKIQYAYTHRTYCFGGLRGSHAMSWTVPSLPDTGGEYVQQEEAVHAAEHGDHLLHVARDRALRIIRLVLKLVAMKA